MDRDPATGNDEQPTRRLPDSDSKPFDSPPASPSPSRKAFWAELAGLSVLVAGLLGYAAYQMVEEAPVSVSAKPSPKLSPKPNRSATKPMPTSDRSGAIAGEPQEIYLRAPKTGIYYAVDSLLNASRREIASRSGRFCIRIVNGPIAPVSGYQQVTTSSLSLDSSGTTIDATQEKLTFDHAYTELKDAKGRWQWLGDKVDRSGVMEQCLAASTSFVKKTRGDFINHAEAAPTD
ncbi:hypothetical protein H6F43_05235 [Leptolyngbya sp. FACHB-36]|nr:hypothetical protein [Leptolyngbya sp. FACHB-36]